MLKPVLVNNGICIQILEFSSTLQSLAGNSLNLDSFDVHSNGFGMWFRFVLLKWVNAGVVKDGGCG